MYRALAAIALLATLGGALSVPASAATLDIAKGAFPDINCKFDQNCNVTVDDSTAAISLPGGSGKGFLQSRLFPLGQKGTKGAGLRAYFYRIDLTQIAGVVNQPCISSLALPFGPIAQLDYDNDGDPDDLVVATQGGLGSVAPTTATKAGGVLTLTFATPVCSGSSPGHGETTFFIGLASSKGPRKVNAKAKVTPGGVTLTLVARAAKP